MLRAITRPPDAAVYLDGAEIGRTPLHAVAPCGAATVRLDRARYEPEERAVTFERGSVQEVSIELRRPSTTLRIESSPRGATVRVRGKQVGTTPVSTTVMAFERSWVEISKVGYRPIKEAVRPKRSTDRLSVSLQSITSGNRTPPGARRPRAK
jgi:hypothetical protein